MCHPSVASSDPYELLSVQRRELGQLLQSSCCSLGAIITAVMYFKVQRLLKLHSWHCGHFVLLLREGGARSTASSTLKRTLAVNTAFFYAHLGIVPT